MRAHATRAPPPHREARGRAGNHAVPLVGPTFHPRESWPRARGAIRLVWFGCGHVPDPYARGRSPRHGGANSETRPTPADVPAPREAEPACHRTREGSTEVRSRPVWRTVRTTWGPRLAGSRSPWRGPPPTRRPPSRYLIAGLIKQLIIAAFFLVRHPPPLLLPKSRG